MTKDFQLCQKQIHSKQREISFCEAKIPGYKKEYMSQMSS